MPSKRRNKRVPKDMSHITKDPKCTLHHWGTKVGTAFPSEKQGGNLGPAVGPALGQEITLSFGPVTNPLPVPKDTQTPPNPTPPSQASLGIAPYFLPLSPDVLTENAQAQYASTIPMPPHLREDSRGSPAGHSYRMASNFPSHIRPGEGYHSPSPSLSSDSPYQTSFNMGGSYYSPSTHADNLTPSPLAFMSGLQLPISPSHPEPEASLDVPIHAGYSSNMGNEGPIVWVVYDSLNYQLPYPESNGHLDFPNPSFNFPRRSSLATSPAQFETSTSRPVHPWHRSYLSYHPMQPGIVDSESASFPSRPANLTNVPSTQVSSAPDMSQNPWNGGPDSSLQVMIRRQAFEVNRNQLASYSLPSASLQQPPPSDSLPPVHHTRGANSRRRTASTPYLIPPARSERVLSSSGSIPPRHIDRGLTVMERTDVTSSFGPAAYECVSTTSQQTYDPSFNNSWPPGPGPSIPSGSRPPMRHTPRPPRSSLRSSQSQQTSLNYMASPSGFNYSVSQLPLEGNSDQHRPNHDMAGWPNGGEFFG
ncbi:hypothetical protein FPV67DRAFT_1472712 [Lyophyllum atratum]|nr:hypothetical protein FPV67DRAFT_1472712 [Lyophyllum atratum]